MQIEREPERVAVDRVTESSGCAEHPLDPSDAAWRARVRVFALCVSILIALFSLPLTSLFRYAFRNELNSHLILVPIVSIYLLYLRWKQLPNSYTRAFGWAGVSATLGIGLLAAMGFGLTAASVSRNDRLALTTFAFLCCVVAAGLLFMGGKWMKAAAFPFAFLLFMVPLPDRVVTMLETASQLASAEAAAFLFSLSGTPFLRQGNVFNLPAITIQVAQECSGIRSSWVLVMTSLLAAQLLLRSTWHRILLIALIIPLGILRNGLRILVIGLLCVNFGPHMIDSPIHRQGGPLFFALSLLPLFLILWCLRRSELKHESRSSA